MLFLFFFLSFSAFAVPDEVEVWFITPPSVSFDLNFLTPKLPKDILVAEACEQVGDFCLDPKGGLYPKNQPRFDTYEQVTLPYEGLPQINPATSLDRNMINCDQKANMFDIFCGEAKSEKKIVPSEFEVWVDVSGSMRSVDDGEGSCYRMKFLQGLFALCDKKTPKLRGFDVGIRDLSISESCVNRGLNDVKKMIQWIEDSKAKKLIIITDVYEYQAEFAAYLSQINAKIKGDRGHFPSVQLMDHITDVAKACTEK
jgi:hypothetical protein